MNTRSGGDGNNTPGAAAPPSDSPGPETEADPTTGLDAALERLRKDHGEDVVTLWRASGPRKGHIAEVACVLAEIGGYPRRIMVQAFTGGTYKLYAEVAGKSADQMMTHLAALYIVNET